MNANHSNVSGSVRTAGLAILMSVSLSACGPEAVVERAEVARPVRMITIGLAEGDETLEIPGSVRAAQSAELAFEVAGRMLERLVEEGQVVTAGQVVAKLDPRDYRARRSWSDR